MNNLSSHLKDSNLVLIKNKNYKLEYIIKSKREYNQILKLKTDMFFYNNETYQILKFDLYENILILELEKTWDYFTHIWKTEAQYLSWVRGNIRNIWKTSPQRSEFLKSVVVKKPMYDDQGLPLRLKNGKIREYKAYICNYCGKICYDKDTIGSFRKTYAVDHIKGNHSLISFDQAPLFFEAMLRVNLTDLQVLCHECHDIKSYSEKYKTTFDEARIEKQAISISKQKLDKQFFIDRNLSIPSNTEKRREEIVKILTKEYSN